MIEELDRQWESFTKLANQEAVSPKELVQLRNAYFTGAYAVLLAIRKTAVSNADEIKGAQELTELSHCIRAILVEGM